MGFPILGKDSYLVFLIGVFLLIVCNLDLSSVPKSVFRLLGDELRKLALLASSINLD